MNPKSKFKAIVRLVIANRSWLLTDTDQNVAKKNISLGKRKKRSALTVEIKGLLSKPAEYRTEEEKNLIYRTIGGFKCFRKYPENMKMMLAACTYFVYYGPNRTIVRQNHFAKAMYFIIHGEVSVSLLLHDFISNKYVETVIGSMSSGDMFGDVSLLQGISRNATITSTTSVEFLILKREDFNNVIRETVQEQWEYTLKSMDKIRYFDDWDATYKSECCILGRIHTYEAHKTVFGDGDGQVHSVYFMINGNCKLIEHIIVEKYYNQHGIQKYRLYDSEKKQKTVKKVTVSSSLTTYNEISKKLKTTVLNALKKTEPSTYSLHHPRKSEQSTTPANATLSKSFIPGKSISSKIVEHPSALVPRTETFFMELCTIDEKGCFGLGENMERRRIIATETVECLVIPRYFIILYWSKQKINKIILSFEKNMPSTKELFFEFIEQRKWNKYREDLVKSLVRKPPCNMLYNVPYSVRIKNMSLKEVKGENKISRHSRLK